MILDTRMLLLRSTLFMALKIRRIVQSVNRDVFYFLSNAFFGSRVWIVRS